MWVLPPLRQEMLHLKFRGQGSKASNVMLQYGAPAPAHRCRKHTGLRENPKKHARQRRSKGNGPLLPMPACLPACLPAWQACIHLCAAIVQAPRLLVLLLQLAPC